MTKIDIISGFLGAGKTTFIKKLLKEALTDEKVVLIENEFGEIGIDGGFLKEAGIEITEMNSGCICCSLVGDFEEALAKVKEQYHPDRIIIEPSGVGKLSDVIKAVQSLDDPEMVLNSFVTVADVSKCKLYMKNFGEFYNNQIEHAKVIVLSRTQTVDQAKLEASVALLKEQNDHAVVITTPWDDISGEQILKTMEAKHDFIQDMMEEESCPVCGHHHEAKHHHHEECACGHDHHHDEETCTCNHNHHDHEHCDCESDHHDHEHCECEHQHDHHHHHADEVFTSWGVETPRTYHEAELNAMLFALSDEHKYGMILRTKGMVQSDAGGWLYFDMVPGETNVRSGQPEVTGRICVIGSKLNEQAVKDLFQVK